MEEAVKLEEAPTRHGRLRRSGLKRHQPRTEEKIKPEEAPTALSLSMIIGSLPVNDKLRSRGSGVEERMAARCTGDGGW